MHTKPWYNLICCFDRTWEHHMPNDTVVFFSPGTKKRFRSLFLSLVLEIGLGWVTWQAALSALFRCQCCVLGSRALLGLVAKWPPVSLTVRR